MILGSFSIRRSTRLPLNESGQSTVEFALTVILLLGFTFFYFQLAMVMAYGNFVHYATFMSARALLSAGDKPSDQMERAKKVIVLTLKKSEGAAGIEKFPAIAKGVGGSDVGGLSIGEGGQFEAHNRNLSWQLGVRYTFRSKLFMIPLAGFGSAGKSDMSDAVNSLTLTSESWLGRETSRTDCVTEMGRHGDNLIDNGC